MPLKLGSISQQVHDMARTMIEQLPAEEGFLQEARDLLRRVNANELREKLDLHLAQQPRFPWLVAMPLDPTVASPESSLSGSTPAPAPLLDYCVVGTDASSISPDRHSSVHYYVLNVGYALLTYGAEPDAVLEASSQLCFRDEELYLFPEKRDVPVEGVILGGRMEAESLRILRKALHSVERPTVALRDGPLILWTLQNEEQTVQDALLHDFLAAMSFLRDAGVPLGGYISYTGSRDVANSLRVWICPSHAGECDQCRSGERELCLALARIRDRDLFAFLDTGERSQLFGSSSQILSRYGEHQVDFFYMDVGGEIIRAEVPRWVSSDQNMLGLLHAAICDQCQRSPGFPPYPPALLEAHEQAVITAPERRLIEEMVEQALGQVGGRVVRSAKDDSKRRRGV